MTSELKNLLNDLSDKRNIDIKEIPLQGGLVVNRDSKTGLDVYKRQVHGRSRKTR